MLKINDKVRIKDSRGSTVAVVELIGEKLVHLKSHRLSIRVNRECVRKSAPYRGAEWTYVSFN